MDSLKQPKPKSLEGNLAVNWKKFKKAIDIYIVASGNDDLKDPIKAAIWLHCMGEETLEILDTLELTEEGRKDPEEIVCKLDEYFVPKTNVSVERHKFNSRVQMANENFDSFLGDLRKIAANCEYGDLKDDLIKDRIVCAINDKRVKDRLLRETDLNLEKAISICKAAEQSVISTK
ncbi:hypothetical protein TcasGA2_TC004209 [Tribolium castaneum]|uniref:Uncharacterized protein n=1 Tax=Tribolium castaneum TaxID=7070 RepID=D7EM16_TRICA|nr:PREDICTED: uncharacterized protein LOC100141835 [Tribolium castaneum]EFA12511.1 hypothetical protein TcasGA2_TC004209 [Tribolium castaneum]|eukprot:XP_015840442.1 PREDICTED: uncharacterized protein LOC100141835 [Tribolium castaneum]